MRLLFEVDLNNYSGCTHTFVRNSARGILIRDCKVAMIHSLKFDYYKFPIAEPRNPQMVFKMRLPKRVPTWSIVRIARDLSEKS